MKSQKQNTKSIKEKYEIDSNKDKLEVMQSRKFIRKSKDILVKYPWLARQRRTGEILQNANKSTGHY